MMKLASLRSNLSKLVAKLSEQSSLSGIASIALMVGMTNPNVYAGGVVAICGILKIFLADSAPVVVESEPTSEQ